MRSEANPSYRSQQDIAMVKVKICGITNARDARAAVRLGADALGFNFYPRSPRYVKKERARAILAALPPFVTAVGVFVDEDPDEVLAICDYVGMDTAQLHGGERPRVLQALSRLKRIKAMSVQSERDIDRLPRYPAEAYLLDAFVPGVPGGTGKTFNWSLARQALRHGPIILAGGLNPLNVAEAVRTVAPYAVDVASGVETEPGVKDRGMMEAFILRAKGVAFSGGAEQRSGNDQ